MSGRARELADWVAGLDLERVPDDAVEAAVRGITDTVGVMLAGVGEPVTQIVAAIVAEDGCRPIASQIGAGLRTSPENAALVNGTGGHALDYDDVNPSMIGHPSVVAVAATLAAAEVVDASGSELIAAYVAAVEAMGALGRAMGQPHYHAGWHATSTLGTLGAALGAGRLLGLDGAGLERALAIAVSEASGSRQNFGTMTKPFHAGHAARCGVHAARLAAAGMTAGGAALDGEFGYFSLFGLSRARPELLLEGLGAPFEVVDAGLAVKRYPCCHATHRALDGVLDVRQSEAVRAEDVEQVRVTTPRGGLLPLIYVQPESGLEGKFSMHYTVSAALLDGEVGLDTFIDERVRSARVRDLVARVEVLEDDSIPDGGNPSEGGWVEVAISTKAGATHRRRVTHPYGSPQRPLTPALLERKFLDCASAVLDEERARAAVTCLGRLPELGSVRELVDAVRPSPVTAEVR
jgi:2-methylcitrate dehydratase PrpD